MLITNIFLAIFVVVVCAPSVLGTICGNFHPIHTGDWEITSPGYPEPPPPNENCTYTINSPIFSYISVEFQNFSIGTFDLESGLDPCSGDRLEVREGGISTPVAVYCGNQLPSQFRTTSNDMQFTLITYESQNVSRGFKLTFRIACGFSFTSSEGYLSLTRWQWRMFSPPQLCDYSFFTDADKYFDLNITAYNLKKSTVQFFDHGIVTRTLSPKLEYNPDDIRFISLSNIVRVRMDYTDDWDKGLRVRYYARNRTISHQDQLFLFHLQTCKGFIPEQDTKAALASNTTKDAVLHRLERVGGRVNDTIQSGNEVYIRTAATPSVATNTGWSLTASRDGSTAYEDWAQDNSTWLIRGDLRHGGRVWLENKELTGQYLGMFGKQESGTDTVKIHVGLCSNPVDWAIFKIPLDFGWDKYSDKGAYQARWVDGLPMAAYQSCLRHPAVFPRCDGSPVPSCLS